VVRLFEDAPLGDAVGLAFAGSALFSAHGDGPIARWDMTTGQAEVLGQSPGVTDLAAAATSGVIDGHLNGLNLSPGAHATVELWQEADGARRLLASVETSGGSPDYWFPAQASASPYYVRVQAPRRADGAPAVQTSASIQEPGYPSIAAGGNEIRPLCVSAEGDYQLLRGSCYGARADAADPVATPDPIDPENGANHVSRVKLTNAAKAAPADFTFMFNYRWGSAPDQYHSTFAAAGPYAFPGLLSLGYAGPYKPEAELCAHACSAGGDLDAVFYAPVPAGGGEPAWLSARDAILAPGVAYRFRAQARGNLLPRATVKAWVAPLVGGVAADAMTDEFLSGTPDVDGYVYGEYQVPAIEPATGLQTVYARARVSADPGVTATSRGPAGLDAESGVQQGDIEDYGWGIASRVLRVKAELAGVYDLNTSYGPWLSFQNAAPEWPSTAGNKFLDAIGGGDIAVAVADPDQPVRVATTRMNGGAAGGTVTMDGWSLDADKTACRDNATGDLVPATVEGANLQVAAPSGQGWRDVTCRAVYARPGDFRPVLTVTPTPNAADPVMVGDAVNASVQLRAPMSSILGGQTVSFSVAPAGGGATAGGVYFMDGEETTDQCDTFSGGFCNAWLIATQPGTYTLSVWDKFTAGAPVTQTLYFKPYVAPEPPSFEDQPYGEMSLSPAGPLKGDYGLQEGAPGYEPPWDAYSLDLWAWDENHEPFTGLEDSLEIEWYNYEGYCRSPEYEEEMVFSDTRAAGDVPGHYQIDVSSRAPCRAIIAVSAVTDDVWFDFYTLPDLTRYQLIAEFENLGELDPAQTTLTRRTEYEEATWDGDQDSIWEHAIGFDLRLHEATGYGFSFLGLDQDEEDEIDWSQKVRLADGNPPGVGLQVEYWSVGMYRSGIVELMIASQEVLEDYYPVLEVQLYDDQPPVLVRASTPVTFYGGPADPAHSYARVTMDPSQRANYNPSTLRETWGKQTVTAVLRDVNGNPSWGAEPWLEVGSGDPYGDVGISVYDVLPGLSCTVETRGYAELCPSGEWTAEVYSARPGYRQLTVNVWNYPEGWQVVNADYAPASILWAPFAGDAVPADSTLMVSPSAPGDNPEDADDEPDGVPAALASGQTYVATVTAWAEGRNMPVGEQTAALALGGPTCAAAFADSGGRSTSGTTSALGHFGAEITGSAGVCELTATVGGEPVAGSPKTLQWSGTAPPSAALSVLTVPTAQDGATVAAGEGPDAPKHRAQVAVKDTLGQPVGAGAANVIFTGRYTDLAGEDHTVVSDAVPTDAAGVAVWEFSSRAAVTWTVSAGLEGEDGDVGSPPQTARFRAGPAQGACSTLTAAQTEAVADGETFLPVVAHLEDCLGNPAAGAAVQVLVPLGVSAAVGNNAVMGRPSWIDATADAEGNARVNFYSDVPGVYAVTGRIGAGGENPIGEGDGAAVTLRFTNSAFSASQSHLTVTEEPAVAGSGHHAAAAVLRDTLGHGYIDEPVDVDFSYRVQGEEDWSASHRVHAAAGSGVAVWTFTLRRAGTYEVKAEVDGARVGGGSTVVVAVFVAGPARVDHVVLTGSGEAKAADGATPHRFEALVGDEFDNPVALELVTFTLPEGDSARFIGADCEPKLCERRTSALGLTAVEVVADSPVSTFITAWIAYGEVGGAFLEFVAVPLSLANSVFDAPFYETAMSVDGESHLLRAQLRDESGQPYLAEPVEVVFYCRLTGTEAWIEAGRPSSDTRTGVAAWAFSTTRAGAYEVKAEIGGVELPAAPANPVVVFKAGTASAEHSVVEASPGSVRPGGATHRVSVTVTDRHGNPVDGETVYLSLMGGPQFSFAAPGECVAQGSPCELKTSALGHVTFEVAAQTPGTAVADVSLADGPIDFVDLAFSYQAAAAETSTWTLEPSGALPVGGDEVFTVRVTTRDADGQIVPGAQILVDVQPDGVDAVGSMIPTSGPDGVAEVELTSIHAGEYRVNVEVGDGWVEPRDVPIRFTPGPPAANQTELDVAKNRPVADGAHEVTAWAIVRDEFENPVPQAEVVFTIGGGVSSLEGPWLIPADGPDRLQATVTTCDFTAASKPDWCDQTGKALVRIASFEPGDFNVTASLAGTPVTGSPKKASFTAGSPRRDLSHRTVTPSTDASPDVMVPPGDCYQVTAELRSELMPIADTPLTLSLTGAGPDVSIQGGPTQISGAVGAWDWGQATWLVCGQAEGVFTGQVTAYVTWEDMVWFEPIGAPMAFRFGYEAPQFTAWLVEQDGWAAADGATQLTARVHVVSDGGHDVDGRMVEFTVPQGVNAVVDGADVAGAPGRVVPVPVADGYARLAYRTNRAGVYGITAQFEGEPVFAVRNASEDVTLNGGGTVHLEFRQSLTPGLSVFDVSPGDRTVGTGTHVATLALKDALGQPFTGPSVSVDFFYRAQGASAWQPGGTAASRTSDGQAVWEFTGVERAGVYEIRAEVDGAPVPDADAIRTVSFVAGPLDVARTAESFAVDQDTRLADGAEAVWARMRAQDAYGNPRQGEFLGFSLDYSGSGPLFGNADAGALTAQAASNGDGWVEAAVYSRYAGSFDVVGTVAGTPATPAQRAHFRAPPRFAPVFSVAAHPSNEGYPAARADGEDRYVVTVRTQTNEGNPVPNTSFVAFFTPVAPTTGTPVQVPGATGDDGVGTAPFSTVRAGTWEAHVRIAGDLLPVEGGGTDVTSQLVEFKAGPASAAASSLAASEGEVPADGEARHWAVATVLDAHGNPAAGETVTFTLADGDASRFAGADCAAKICPVTASGTGEARVEIQADAPVTARLEARVADGTVGGADLVFASTRPPVRTSWLVEPAWSAPADGASPLPVGVRVTEDGSPVSGAEAVFSVPAGLTATWGAQVVAGADGASIAVPVVGGAAEVSFTAAAPGAYSVTAAVDGESVDEVRGALAPDSPGRVGGEAYVTFTPVPCQGAGCGDLTATWTIEPVDETLVADGVASFAARVIVVDADGDPAADVDVAFLVPGAVRVAEPEPHATGADGTFTARLSSLTSGQFTVNAQVDGAAVTPADQVLRFKAGPAAAARSRLWASPGEVAADGVAEAWVRAELRDANGNLAPGGTVVFALPAGVRAGTVAGPAAVPVAAGPDGVAELALTGRIGGAYPVTGAVGGVAVEDGSPATVVFYDRTPPLAPAADPSNGAGVTGTVHAQDLADAAEGLLNAVAVDPAAGGELSRGAVGADGRFALDLPGLADGAQFALHVEDATGNRSEARLVTVDAAPPESSALAPSDGSRLGGSGGEAGASVSVVAPGGAELCSAAVGPGGGWACDLVPAAVEGDLVRIVERDQAGNTAESTWRIGLPRVVLSPERARPGAAVSVSGANFQPGESVSAVMRSDPIELGTAAASADGGLTLAWTVPADAEEGGHTVELAGALSGTWTAAFEVVPADEPTTTPPTDGPTTGPPTDGPTTTPPTDGPTTTPPTDGPTTGPPTDGPTTTPPTDGPTTGPPTDGPTTTPPTDGPTTTPPTDGPTTGPPTDGPTTGPPTDGPTDQPTDGPPTDGPTTGPPTDGPTTGPPTDGPTDQPTDGPPTDGPTDQPTDGPTDGPTDDPTDGPTTDAPTTSPPPSETGGDQVQRLPFTGATAAPLAALAGIALALGAALVRSALRRRATS
jgi:hypothetical protein